MGKILSNFAAPLFFRRLAELMKISSILAQTNTNKVDKNLNVGASRVFGEQEPAERKRIVCLQPINVYMDLRN